MRYLFVTAVVLLSWSWAQQYGDPRQTRVLKRIPEIDAIFRQAQWVPIDLNEGITPSSQPLRRTTDFGANLGFLKPSQDADTVPDVASTQPDYAGDTLLANNAGQDIDVNISSDCHHSFFDSLYLHGSWLFIYRNGATVFGNYLFPWRTINDTTIYVGGGIAERYDIEPPQGARVYIKGIATRILNNYFSRTNPAVCQPTTGEVGGGPWQNDNVYTVGYQLLDTIHVQYNASADPNQPDIRDGSYPDAVVAEVTKPLSQVRIGYGRDFGQCVSAERRVLELMDHAYFSQPVEISSPKSYYVAVRYDLYIEGVDQINDTLFGLIGPRSPLADANISAHPCLTADTTFLGRNMVLMPFYDGGEGRYIDTWYPQWFWVGYELNFVLHPIIYVTGIPGNVPMVRNGSLSFSAPYPNPAVDCIHLNVESSVSGSIQLHLYTTEGRLVRTWSRRIESGMNTIAMDLDVPAGAYLLQAQSPYGAASFWVNVVK